MEVMFRKRTAMNFFILFATLAANSILVIGRCFTVVESVVYIYDECESGANRTGFIDFTLDCQGEHPII